MPIDASFEQEFSDADFRIVAKADQSKKLAFDVSGITTATKRTITVPDADLTLNFGTYTPTLTNTTNVASSTAAVCQWSRVGSVVTVSGRFVMNPTSTGAATTLGLTLPVPSSFTSTSNLGGTATDPASTTIFSASADTSNNRAMFQATYGGTGGSKSYFFTFAYVII